MALPGSHSWEGWSPVGHDVPGVPGGWDDLDEQPEIDYDNMVPLEAAEMFEDLLVSLKLQGHINATQCCSLAFFAHKAGCPGDLLKALAVKPNAQSGRFSRVFDSALGSAPRDANLYEVGLARRLRYQAFRSFDYIETLPLHEALHNEFAASDSLIESLAKAKEHGELPSIYWEHPVVKDNPTEQIHPFCIFVDGLAFGRGESCLAFWCYFLFSTERHLCAVLRKSELCSCGCRGWCSVSQVWAMLAWGVVAVQSGVQPTSRHDRMPWRPSDTLRSPTAGEPFGFRACCLFIKGDWAEFASSLGVPTWGALISPCPLCFVEPPNMADATELSPLGIPGAPKNLATFEAACSACEIIKDLSAEDLQLVENHLVYDKSKDGSRGRALIADLPTLGLRMGDRVEPSIAVPDVGFLVCLFGTLSVTFWRPSLETAYRHRCAIFGSSTRLSAWNLGVDWLHCLSLGVFQFWLAELIADLLACNAWCVAGAAAARYELGVAHLREELFGWYRSESSQGRHHTRVQRLVPSMFGSLEPGKRTCHLHGAETNSFLAFSEVLLSRHGHKLGDRSAHHVEAGFALKRILARIRRYPRVFPMAEIQGFCSDVQRHLGAIAALGVNPRPKHHFLIEMAARFWKHGIATDPF